MTVKRDWAKGRPSPWPERFWRRVERSKELFGCWICSYAPDTSGYPHLRVNGRLRRASHIAWELAHGIPFPSDMFCCHHCDNRRCVNPTHLFLGDHQANASDMCAKGRQATGDRSSARLHPERRPRGERHPKAKLTEEDVREVRRLAAAGMTRRAIAARYETCHTTINHIVNRRTWREID